MKTTCRVLLALALALASGCARPDWIEQTLVTADVTGTWQSSEGTFLELKLEQRGTKVEGSVLRPKHYAGPIEGTVAGDLFTFRRADAGGSPLRGRMRVNGDEMSGRFGTGFGSVPGAGGLDFRLRRVSSSPVPSSQQQ